MPTMPESAEGFNLILVTVFMDICTKQEGVSVVPYGLIAVPFD
jgi:hypothetical protein